LTSSSFHELQHGTSLNRIRWLILLLGPAPIVGASWAVSAWFQSEPRLTLAGNHVLSTRGALQLDEPSSWSSHGDEDDAALALACAQSCRRLEAELGPDCQVLVRSPFVLGGDFHRDELHAWHRDTIVPAVRAMQASYFQTRPNQPITVLLFRGEQSYNRYSQKLFAEAGISQYGYYKPNSRTLLLNAATGSGTLLHELTHALVDFDFPAVPDWLNEGLASLHEQCRFRTDDSGPWIEGLVNWRLKGLQEVIRQQRLRSLVSLVEERNFRGSLEGTNYAQARYFCLFMQQRRLLEGFFHAFRRNHHSDPKGLATLAATFDEKTWQQLDHDFQAWVLELAEPPAAGSH
jgi:hypothetical protein